MRSIERPKFVTGLVCALGAAVLFAAEVEAQDTDPDVIVEACDTPAHHQFDFWLGTWDVKPMSAPPEQPARAVNRIFRIQGGCVIKEEYTTQGGYAGESFNIYDASRGGWHQTWVDNGGALLVLDGEFVDGAMVLEGETLSPEGAVVLNRVTWSLIDEDPNRVRQHWETSSDSGESWTTSFDGLYVKREG